MSPKVPSDGNEQTLPIINTTNKESDVIDRRIMGSRFQISVYGSRPSRLNWMKLTTTLTITILILSSKSIRTSASPSASDTASINPHDNSLNNTISQQTSSIVDEIDPILGTPGRGSVASSSNNVSITNIDPQSTELSSMYVQVPIADPGIESSNSDRPIQQQTVSSDGSSSTGLAGSSQDPKSWSGNWPKKFQIGYIKQSDLHQVLMESLKNEPFSTIGGGSQTESGTKSGGSTKSVNSVSGSTSTKTSLGATKKAPSDSTSLMNPGPVAAISKTSPAQWPTSLGNQYNSKSNNNNNNQQQHHHRMHQSQHQAGLFKGPMQLNYRHPSSLMQHHGPNHFGRGFGSSLLPNFRHMNQQSPFHQNGNFNNMNFGAISSIGPKGPFNHRPQPDFPMFGFHHNHQQQQLPPNHQPQFQYQSNGFKNQPIYTMNNPPSINNFQEQLDINPMQVINKQFANESPSIPSRPHTKSTDYQSSLWKPVTSTEQSVDSDGATKGLSGGADQVPQINGLNDGFDDEFGSQANVGQTNKDTMNRHPALDSYLSGTQNGQKENGGKLSPAMISRQQSGLSSSTNVSNSGTKSSIGTAGVKGKSSSGNKSPVDVGSTKIKGRDGESGTKRREMPQQDSLSPTLRNGTTLSPQASTDETSPTTESGDSQTTTTTTTAASITASSVSSSTTPESETQDPESEVVETETSEPNSGSNSDTETTTTSTTTTLTSTGSSIEAAQQGASGSSSSTTQASSDGGESEGSNSSTSTTSSTGGVQNSREETTPSNRMTNTEVEGMSQGMAAGSGIGKSSSAGSESMSDEALVASLNKSDLSKANQEEQQQQQQKSKKARSSERLSSVQNNGKQTNISGSTKKGSSSSSSSSSSSNKLITKKAVVLGSSTKSAGSGSKTASARNLKQQSKSLDGSKSAEVKGTSKVASPSRQRSNLNLNSKQKSGSGSDSDSIQNSNKSAKLANGNKRNKLTRMAGTFTSQSQVQQPIAQVVSMSAAQAQSTAQTLASILLSRCMSSTNCAHLLDVCSTKQASFSLASSENNNNLPSLVESSTQLTTTGGDIGSTNNDNSNNRLARQTVTGSSSSNGNWSRPVGLPSSQLMPLAQALQADKVLRVFPQWRDSIESVMDQEAQTGYSLILPSNEAIDELSQPTIDSWLANGDLLSQIIENHILDSSEIIEIYSQNNNQQQAPVTKLARTRVIRSKGIQINQHRDKMITMNGKRLIYANQIAPGKLIENMDTLLFVSSLIIISISLRLDVN